MTIREGLHAITKALFSSQNGFLAKQPSLLWLVRSHRPEQTLHPMFLINSAGDCCTSTWISSQSPRQDAQQKSAVYLASNEAKCLQFPVTVCQYKVFVDLYWHNLHWGQANQTQRYYSLKSWLITKPQCQAHNFCIFILQICTRNFIFKAKNSTCISCNHSGHDHPTTQTSNLQFTSIAKWWMAVPYYSFNYAHWFTRRPLPCLPPGCNVFVSATTLMNVSKS